MEPVTAEFNANNTSAPSHTLAKSKQVDLIKSKVLPGTSSTNCSFSDHEPSTTTVATDLYSTYSSIITSGTVEVTTQEQGQVEQTVIQLAPSHSTFVAAPLSDIEVRSDQNLLTTGTTPQLPREKIQQHQTTLEFEKDIQVKIFSDEKSDNAGSDNIQNNNQVLSMEVHPQNEFRNNDLPVHDLDSWS